MWLQISGILFAPMRPCPWRGYMQSCSKSPSEFGLPMELSKSTVLFAAPRAICRGFAKGVAWKWVVLADVPLGIPCTKNRDEGTFRYYSVPNSGTKVHSDVPLYQQQTPLLFQKAATFCSIFWGDIVSREISTGPGENVILRKSTKHIYICSVFWSKHTSMSVKRGNVNNVNNVDS